MKSNKALFLETTIQIGRFLSTHDNMNKINEVLSKYMEISSSSYVKMEFKGRLIQDLVYLYNDVLVDAEDFGDAFQRLSKLHSVHNKRKINVIIASFAKFFIEENQEEISGELGKELLEIAISYFRQIIESLWEDFDNKVNKLLDGTGCFHAKNRPVFKNGTFDNTMKRCKSSKRKCKIVDFFIQNKNAFQKIYKEFLQINELDEEQKKAKEILEKALNHPENISEWKNCRGCGDAIISVEVPQNALLFTTNVKHFRPICSVLKKELCEI